ncbi:recombinase family protein [Coraliomargarita akajimensis]|uniref:Resolvase domain protein n=1 Tax=Coraliomargarita akajimensis (strain DSM 45221 / IAM 15411 / JCM 23193 / KCTC 12865 / 04OKA010-24) TaxID=583355 RepID=D5EIC4_CORAD|nr:recombinase family protein [Coraliomargarita akajimensis]ADE54190.1 Resolvase domain protein [Coraliomargarita akajimensis DSM 45221]
MVKAAIYLRVSTKEQSVASQKASTERTALLRGYETVLFEDQASGAKSSREGLDAMMYGVRKGKFCAIICYKLDRLGRSLPHLAQLIAELDANGVGLIVSDQGIDTTDQNPAGRLQLNVLMAVAEFERSMIRDRTIAGLEAAKRRGVRLGRPKGSKSLSKYSYTLAVKLLAENPKLSCPKLARATGVSVGTAHRWRKEILTDSLQDAPQ